MKKRIAELIRARDDFLITSHQNPDGDSIGSQLALALALERMGKKVSVINYHPIPPLYQPLPGIDKVRVCKALQRAYPVAFVLECSFIERIGLQGLEGSYIINIDHHRQNTRFGHLNWVDIRAAAVGEMIYDLIKLLGIELTPTIASSIYTAIITDTGSFHYSNTSARTFTICSELVKRGVKPAWIADILYYSNQTEKIKTLGEVLSSLEMDPNGKIAWLTLPQRSYPSHQVPWDETEDYVIFPQSIKGVEVSLLFKEIAPNSYRVSLRSRGNVDVSEIAEKFGGGGHHNAAGCSVEGDYQAVREIVLQQVKESLKKQNLIEP